ncbi:uncharacterized protein LOC107701190 [Sinocyclocheilus anshuiensis]|uniref:uncharacterized protein LOC107701190 n=1 Tax=Sinocyclocheilus anshuiensis TaxID=1608454 RepID=UPI0007B9690A|nr:PREDICTED: uncharacterized protein LOC107701190 [Sinocyclocheilus anshuiensis]
MYTPTSSSTAIYMPAASATYTQASKKSSSTSISHISSAEPCDSPVELEGWVRLWENPNGIPPADLSWVKDDPERGLFGPIQAYRDNTGVLKRSRALKSDRMWFYPPEPPGYISGPLPTPHLFFRSRVFVWQPVGVWKYLLKCPRGAECVGQGKAVYLYKSGYHTRVCHICDVSSWYCMLTEVLCCGQCTKAAGGRGSGKVGHWLAWDPAILCQLSEAHQAMFPAVLTDTRGVDKNQTRLFTEAIDNVWESQQQHLECIQDPPDMNMYRLAQTTTINGIDVPCYKCLRGSNSLEGFHKALSNMIPGPHCAAHPCQVYLISGIARWNSGCSSDAVFGGKSRCHRAYSAPLIDRLNTRCQQLFGETVEENIHAPANVTSNELLGLEYLFSQSTGESGPFSLSDISKDGPSPEEEVIQPGQSDTDEDDVVYKSDPEADNDIVPTIPAHINLTTDKTTAAHSPAFEDVCSSNPLPGFQQLEKFCSLLVEICLTEDKLSLTTEQRNRLIEAWSAVEEHDKQPPKFHQLYKTHWGNALYCRTKRDDLALAQQDISSQHNRLMYTLVKLLWLGSPHSTPASPVKTTIAKAYERLQHRVLVEDPVLSILGIPLPKIDTKTVCDFIRRQERLVNLRSTELPSAAVLKTMLISSKELPLAPCQPSVLPPPDLPQIKFEHISSKAGTKVLKGNTDTAMPVPKALLPLQHSESAPIPHSLLPVRVSRVTDWKTPVTSIMIKPLAKIASSATRVIPATSTNTTPVTMSTSQTDTSQSIDSPSAWARATLYKRKHTGNLTNVGIKKSRVQKLPVCTLCSQPTQGHKKYKKKTFCPVKMMSTSKGLCSRVYSSYEHFTSVVDLRQ